MTSDASVTALMDHMDGVDKRRRLVMMQHKKAETKIALATQEQKELTARASAMVAQEEQLKKELELMMEEQRHLQGQLTAEANRVRHCEAEEVVLLSHAQEAVRKVDDEHQQWCALMQELDELRRTWEEDKVRAALKDKLAALETTIAACKAEQASLDAALAEGDAEVARLTQLRVARAARRDGGAGQTNSTTAFPLDMDGVEEHDAGDPVTAATAGAGLQLASAEDGVIQRVKENLQQVVYGTEQASAQFTRQRAALQREVDDLGGRAEDLARWLTEVQTSRVQLERIMGVLHVCVDAKMCSNCLGVEGSSQ